MATMTKERRKKSDGGISLNYEAFKGAVITAAHAVQSRSPRQVLLNLCIGEGRIVGSDGDYRIDVAFPDASFEPVLIPCDRLMKIVRVASSDRVVISHASGVCEIQIGTGKWKLPTQDASEYPEWSTGNLHSMFSMPGDEFQSAVKSVIYAIDKDSSRYAMGGVLIEAEGEDVFFVATDGRRASIAKCERSNATDDFAAEPENGTLQKPAPIVPTKPLTQLMNHASAETLVSIQYGGGVFVGTSGDVTVTARTIDGRFPRWRGILPEQMPPANQVDRVVLQSAAKAAAVVTTQESKGVSFLFGDDGLTLTAKASDVGESKVEAPIETFRASAHVRLDPSFVDQFLRPFDSDSEPLVSVHVVEGDGKTVMTVGEKYTGVIMPLAKD